MVINPKLQHYAANFFTLIITSETSSKRDLTLRTGTNRTPKTGLHLRTTPETSFGYGCFFRQDLQTVFSASRHEPPYPQLYDIFKKLDNVNSLLPARVFVNKNEYDEILYKLFMSIINSGITCFTMASRYEEGLIISNYLKKDKNYYSILESQWPMLEMQIRDVLSNI